MCCLTLRLIGTTSAKVELFVKGLLKRQAQKQTEYRFIHADHEKNITFLELESV